MMPIVHAILNRIDLSCHMDEVGFDVLFCQCSTFYLVLLLVLTKTSPQLI